MGTLLLERGPAIRRVILLTMVIGIPTVFLRGTNDPFNTPKLTLLLIGVGAVAALRAAEILQGASAGGLTRLWIPTAAIAGPLTIAWALSPYRGWSLFGLVGRYQGLIPYLVVVALGVLVADEFVGRADELAVGFLWAGGVVAGYAVIQFVGLDPFNWDLGGGQTSALSTLGNPNFTGGFLGMTLPVGLALLFARPDRRSLVARLLVVVVVGWLLTRSQGGWAAGIAGSAVLAGSVASGRWALGRAAGFGLACLIAVGIIGAVVYSTVSPEARFASSAFEVRGRWWVAAAGMGFDSPVVGRGPNSFAIEGVEHRTVRDALEFNYDFTNDPHSVPLSFLANAGFLGLIGFLVAVVWAVWRWKGFGSGDILSVGFFGSTVAYLIQSLVSIDELSLRAGLWVALAGVAIPPAPRKQSSNRNRGKKQTRSKRVTGRPLQKVPVVVTLGICLLATTAWSVLFLINDRRVTQAARLIALEEPHEARSRFERVHAFREDAVYQAIEALNFKRVALRLGIEGEDYREYAGMAFESYVHEVPFMHGITEYGRLADEWGEEEGRDDDERAAELFSRAVAIDPLNPLIRAELAQILVELDRAEEASPLMEEAAELDIPNAQFWGTLALVRAELGQETEAREALELALAIDPAEATAVQAQEILDRP